MRISNRKGTVHLEDATAEVVKECFMQTAHTVRNSLFSLIGCKNLNQSLEKLNSLCSPTGILSYDWMKDSMLRLAFEDKSIQRPLLKPNDAFTRNIGKFRIAMYLRDMREERNKDLEPEKPYIIRIYLEKIWQDEGNPELRQPVCDKFFTTEDEAIQEYFNAKEYMHIFCEE